MKAFFLDGFRIETRYRIRSFHGGGRKDIIRETTIRPLSEQTHFCLDNIVMVTIGTESIFFGNGLLTVVEEVW